MSKLNKEKFMSSIQKSWQNGHCNMCGGTNWGVGEEIFELREFQDGNLVVGGPTKLYPVVPVVCSKCGHVIFVNPNSIGCMEK